MESDSLNTCGLEVSALADFYAIKLNLRVSRQTGSGFKKVLYLYEKNIIVCAIKLFVSIFHVHNVRTQEYIVQCASFA